MKGRRRAGGGLTVWLVFLLVTVVVLHTVGGRVAPPPLSSEGARLWLDQRQPVDVAFAVLRLVALALGWYLLAVTVAALLARLARLATVVTAIDVVTVPGVRRLVNTALGLSLVATSYPGLAAAGTAEPPAVETMRRLPDRGTPAPGSSPPPTMTMRPLPDEPRPPASPRPPGGSAASAAGSASGSWPVRPGDHLWAVAEKVLTTAWGRAPTDAEVTPYWRLLVDANRSGLHDPDNPDLLFPGQTLTVPPPPAVPSRPSP
jgi:LysM domain